MSKGGGGACECRSGGVCLFFVGWMTSRRQCPRGGGVLVNVLSPPLQEILYPRLPNKLRKHVTPSRAYTGIQRRAVDVVTPSEVEGY